MSSTPTSQLVREFAICATLSFIIILGLVHGCLHLLHISIVSGNAMRSPLARLVSEPALRISQIADLHAHLIVVFQTTIMCSVLVFAVREIARILGPHFGFWQKETDVESGVDEKAPLKEELSWRPDVKAAEAAPAADEQDYSPDAAPREFLYAVQ
ncbi:hypothetical protein C8R43DRAFT_1127415 [Mycena crocata]|nr:hypothetical protein C8R43DRAFT_1127415 [Mycena crocata]